MSLPSNPAYNLARTAIRGGLGLAKLMAGQTPQRSSARTQN